MLFFAYLCAMKRKYLLCLWVAIASVMTSCEDAQLDDGLCSSKHFPRTVIVYMAAENSLARYVATDSVEISKALSDIDENARVVLYIDDTKRGGSRICAGSRNFPMRQVKTYDRNICSTDSADMSMVLHDIVRSFPSESYGLVFWSHASGWLFPSEGDTIIGRSSRRYSFGIDNGHRSTSDNGEKMSIPTLQNVLTSTPVLCNVWRSLTSFAAYAIICWARLQRFPVRERLTKNLSRLFALLCLTPILHSLSTLTIITEGITATCIAA